MQILVKYKYFKTGFKLLLFPFFVSLVFGLTGFTEESKSEVNNFLLIKSGFNYYNNRLQPDEKVLLLSEKTNRELDNTSTLDFLSFFKDQDSTDSILPDSSMILSDTTVVPNLPVIVNDTIVVDSTKLKIAQIDSMAIDSTARLKYFKYKLKSVPYTQLIPPKKSKFFVYPSSSLLIRSVQLDSTGQFVLIKESIAGKKYKDYMKIPLEDYIAAKLREVMDKSWETIGSKYEVKTGKKDLSQLITDITNIDIPLPSTSIFSIFGPPKINIKINGAVDIHGAWRSETTEGITLSALGNTRNEPDFKQQVQINVNGTVGDKLTIAADWNTERTFQYENQLKIKYTGYEDEIIKSIEAGNVSLQTSPLVGGSEALFGIKAYFQMGPFSLTALASQKKGEIQEVSLSSGAQSQTFEVHAYDYSPNHFFINEVYADTSPQLNLFNKYYGNPVPLVVDSLFVKDIEVWKSITGLINPNERKGNAFINLSRRQRGQTYSVERDSTLQTLPGVQEIGRRFIKLTEGVDYIIHKETGYLTFITQIQDQDAIGVAYRIEGPTISSDDDFYFGEFLQDLSADTTATIVLKLVKPPNLQPRFRDAWKLQLKNIYPVGGRDVKEEGFTLDIKFLMDGQEPRNDYQGVKLLEAFGLDKTDQSGTSPNPDGGFDFFPGRTIFPLTGEIVFPFLQPFGDNFPQLLPDTLAYNAVYDTTVTFAKQDRAKDKFILVGEYSASVSSTYSIGFNVVENSVRVMLNGQPMVEGIGYTVDYNIGQIVIRDDRALVPGADLKITYEQNDLFQLASKTLLGLRGVYEFNKQTKLGFSFLGLNQQTLSDKVRIGEEPLNNLVMGADFETSIDLPFVTKGLDKIISTKEMSNLSLKGEYAYISPDPNTKKSTIASDNSASIAYIDDFEGAKRIIPVGISYSGWKDLSVPNKHPLLGTVSERTLMNNKANTYWFNITPSDVNVSAIWGDRKRTSRESAQEPVLDLVYIPIETGTYNWNPDLNIPTQNWGGFMTKLSSTANNLIEENIEFIEFWFHISEGSTNTKLYIDLGQISEDVIPNGRLDTEDKNLNDLVDEGEDTGLDQKLDTEEPNYNSITNPDPSGDNYSFQFGSGDYTHVNGTQGNASSIEQGRLPDTEDLNRNFTLDQVNSYYRYEVPLDTNKLTNQFISGGGDNAGWYQIRVPLKDFIDEIGSPSLSIVETIRFLITGVDERVHIRFAQINLVGNQWQKVLIPGYVTQDDTVLTISTINYEDNPEYVMPEGLQRERDRSKPDEEVYKNEQSLRLTLTHLSDGDKREVVKYLFKPLDLFNYREMKLFLHGDMDETPGSVSYYADENNYGAQVYFRFGSDSLNFYEYRQPVRADWNEIKLVFSELTAIKENRTSDSTLYQVPVSNLPGNFYGVRGNPTLTRVTFFTVGIINPRNIGIPYDDVSGEIWVNELRVLNADDTPGWAYTAFSSLKLADLLKVDFSISQTDPYFHKLNDRFGSRVNALNWSVNSELDLLKLIPFNMGGSNIRLNYTRTESLSKPVYIPGTDINVDEASKQLEEKLSNEGIDPEQIAQQVSKLKIDTETLNVSETWTISNFRIKIPSDAWYFRHTINSLTFGFNYNKKTGRDPTTLDNNSWIWNANANYNLNFGNELYISLVDIPILNYIFDLFTDYKMSKVYFLPQNISLGISASRKRSFIQSRTLNTEPNIQRDFTANRSLGFAWRLTEGGFFNWSLNYNLNIASSLTYLLTTIDGIERNESDIWGDIFGGKFFGQDFDYKQSLDLKTALRLPSLWDIDKNIRLDFSFNSIYNWRNNFQQEDLGRSAGFNNKFSVGLNVKLQPLFNPLFQGETKTTKKTAPTSERRGRGNQTTQVIENVPKESKIDSIQISVDTLIVESDSTKVAEIEQQVDEGPGAIENSLNALKMTVKYILFDYDQISINFTQNTSAGNSGLAGEGTGFNNFWGIKYSSNKGPSRAYILGLTRNAGPRAPNGNLSDNFSENNRIDMRTSRTLWEGARIDVMWNIAWGLNKSTTLNTDSLGNVSITNITSTGTINRSFLTVPPVFFLSFAANGIQKVSELYNPNSPNPNQSLSDAFLEGFEGIPLLSKIPFLAKVAKYIPRPNWSFNWTGLEKIGFLDFAKKITIDHAYVSTYSEGWKINPDGLQEIQTQQVEYGFSPLIGLSITFDKLWDGNLTGSFKFATKTSYNMGVSTRNITETFSRDINITASYSKTGFEIPMFGISLKNDLEISFTYTSGRNSVVVYEMDNFIEGGTPQDGTTRTVIEPRIKYIMSARVTLSLFYRRTSVEPEGAARIPPTTTNEAGLDVHIAIQ